MRKFFPFFFMLTATLFSSCNTQNEKLQPSENPIVIMKTTLGDVKIELNKKKAPLSVKNFLIYVNKGFYNGTIFHRVMNNFMIQGGGFKEDMTKKATLPAIENEAHNGLKNLRGTLAMARTSDINSATSQFFINVKNNPHLDHRSKDSANYGYAVFGKVVDGMDIIDKIKEVPTANKGIYMNVPVKTVVIESIKEL